MTDEQRSAEQYLPLVGRSVKFKEALKKKQGQQPMEEWQEDFEWLRIRHKIKDRFGKPTLPDLDAILFLIGIQELGRWQEAFTKEEKQDLMHIAVCRLLSYDGYYEFVGRDEDGWPHWRNLKPFSLKGVNSQEKLLKEKAIYYFRELEEE